MIFAQARKGPRRRVEPVIQFMAPPPVRFGKEAAAGFPGAALHFVSANGAVQ